VKYFVSVSGNTHEVELRERLGVTEVSVNGAVMDLSYEEVDDGGQVVLMHAGRSYAISIEGDERTVTATLAGHLYGMQLEDERERAAHLAESARATGGGPVAAVMPGVVARLLVAEGDAVVAGQPLLILEAMKMQNEIDAPGDGVVEALHVAAGTAVAAGDKLVTLRAASAQ
jgi:biotin carboxyl carrier protein